MVTNPPDSSGAAEGLGLPALYCGSVPIKHGGRMETWPSRSRAGGAVWLFSRSPQQLVAQIQRQLLILRKGAVAGASRADTKKAAPVAGVGIGRILSGAGAEQDYMDRGLWSTREICCVLE